MISHKLIIFEVVVILESLSGVTLNSCILAIYIKEWRHGTRLKAFHQVHMSMALVNIVLQCTVIVVLFVVWSPRYYFKEVLILLVLSFSFIHLGFWLMTCLCVYYVVSISNSGHRVWSWLKSNISIIVPKFILVSAVGSFALNVPNFWTFHFQTQNTDSSVNITLSSTNMGDTVHMDPVYQLISSFLGSFLPIGLSTLCLGHALTSLLMHMWRIKHTSSTLSRPNLQSHIRAVRSMALILILCLIFLLAQVSSFISTPTIDNNLYITSCFLMVLFPTLQALVIIQATLKTLSHYF
uniref:Taste receptor type 2 n=1 Tax=Leptobrachium leishanense TaxID=445787 RepID=A0A8C5QEV1_9ANUR